MKEAVIRKKAIEILSDGGWVCWYPAKVKYHETDIFGVYDLICGSGSTIRLIQLTTLSNVSARRRKIKAFTDKHKLNLPSEIWGYNKKKRIFKIEKL